MRNKGLTLQHNVHNQCCRREEGFIIFFYISYTSFIVHIQYMCNFLHNFCGMRDHIFRILLYLLNSLPLFLMAQKNKALLCPTFIVFCVHLSHAHSFTTKLLDVSDAAYPFCVVPGISSHSGCLCFSVPIKYSSSSLFHFFFSFPVILRFCNFWLLMTF